jgi:hypothetical protein
MMNSTGPVLSQVLNTILSSAVLDTRTALEGFLESTDFKENQVLLRKGTAGVRVESAILKFLRFSA